MSKKGVPFENNRKKKPAFEQAFYIWSCIGYEKNDRP